MCACTYLREVTATETSSYYCRKWVDCSMC